MAASAALTYEQIYSQVRNGYTGDSSIWDKTYDYILHHPNELFLITPDRRWAIGHQIVYHGNLKLFKRLISLYNEDNLINIFSPTKDTPTPRTILDIANERKGYYKEQFTYIEHLFDQDKFIRACKANNWQGIDEMLKKDPTLLNQKPPYYSNYFIHYLVLYGDVRKFVQYNLPNNKFQLDLQNADGKTALDLARERRDKAFIDEIQQTIPMHGRDSDRDRDSRETERTFSDDVHGPNNVKYTVPPPPVLTAQVKKNLTCPLTKKLFVDPVTASDGKTYERKAIKDWIRDNRYSPQTGEPIDPTFTDDTHTKDLINYYRQQNLL